MAWNIGQDALYDENSDPDLIRAALRAGGFLNASIDDATHHLSIQDAITDEIKRGPGAPGSSWNDEERAQWGDSLDAAKLESASRQLLLPEEAVEAAVESVTTPPEPTFMDALGEELEKLSTPPAHQQRLREANVEAWERENPDKA